MWPVAMVITCVLVLAIVGLYVPTVYIRKTNKLLEVLGRIEANTHK